MPETMTKPDAVGVLADSLRSEQQPTPREFRRLVRAMTVLGLTPEEMRQACRNLDVASATGHLYRKDLEPLAPWLKVPA